MNGFIEGKRARHVHPLRVYLIASVIFFLLIKFLSKDTHLQTAASADHTQFSLASSPTPIPLGPVTPSPGSSLGLSFLPTPGEVPSPEPKEIFAEFARAIIGLGFLLALKSTALTAVACTFLGFAIIIQLLVAIRRVYRQNWFATLFKFGLGSLIYIVLLSIAFGVTALVTLVVP